jgi:hypothetical protein
MSVELNRESLNKPPMPLHCSLDRESSGLESDLEDVGGGE